MHTKSFLFTKSTLYQELRRTFFPDTINNFHGNFQACMQNHLQTMNLRCIYLKIHRSTFNVKVNSVQEACAKCFAVHILKFEILQIT